MTSSHWTIAMLFFLLGGSTLTCLSTALTFPKKISGVVGVFGVLSIAFGLILAFVYTDLQQRYAEWSVPLIQQEVVSSVPTVLRPAGELPGPWTDFEVVNPQGKLERHKLPETAMDYEWSWVTYCEGEWPYQGLYAHEVRYTTRLEQGNPVPTLK